MKNRIILSFWIINILLFPPGLLQAKNLKEAMNEAAVYFTKTAIHIEANQKLHLLKITDIASGKNDPVGKEIETELYFALEKLSPDFGLFLGPGENKEDEINLSGTYELQGDKSIVKLRIFKGSRILAQTEVTYEIKTRSKALVAVLDLEATTLSADQRKAFSDIFRSALSDADAFDMASSADVDKMNPDDVQQATGCSRDACATIIGEQLGVDRVISSSLFQLSKSEYVLSAKVLDIMDGSVLVSKTIEFEGDLKKLRPSLRTLAYAIAGKTEEKLEEKTPVSNWVWHGTAIGIALFSMISSQSEAGKYNDLASANNDLESRYALAQTQAELTAIEKEFDANKEAMSQHKGSIQLFDMITIAALAWEGYLFFFSGSDSDESRAGNHSLKPEIEYKYVFQDAAHEKKLSFIWRW